VSPGTVVAIIESVLLAVVLLFVVALLRSHAEILRRLAAIDAGDRPGAGSPVRGGIAAGAAATGADAPVADIVGETLAGDAVKVALGAGSPRTLLAFLSSGCAACEPLWLGLGRGESTPPGARLVVVTKGPERERLSRLIELAPPRAEVVMSTAAWTDYAIPATPHFVLVDGESGGILGRGSANTWEQIGALVRDADADTALHRARTTSERAARAEQALAAAGIAAGHPSLYPSRRGAARDGDA
jgi:hypothetical protein